MSELTWLVELPAQAGLQVLRHLDATFDNFFNERARLRCSQQYKARTRDEHDRRRQRHRKATRPQRKAESRTQPVHPRQLPR
ncbi:hypothetical protein [Streptomyces sp. NBC_01618]|uniref:hypothetical protein n=1 Tax=Streptomyces sp. NBC_01618 TaxID=2975900 RepID=UPI0038664803|nr:hypothetical protein OH735_13840 [Streptomyces sp. NBC_01618]